MWVLTVVEGGSIIGVIVVGVAVVTASALGQPVHSKAGTRKTGTPFLFYCDMFTYVATIFKLLGWAGRPAPCALRLACIQPIR